MPRPVIVAAVQHCAGLDQADNLARLAHLVAEAKAGGAELVCLPEYCATYGTGPGGLVLGERPEVEHAGFAYLRRLARRHAVWLAVGSLAVAGPDGRTVNRSFLLDPEGQVRARYDKIHLFDVDLANGERYRESERIAPGAAAVLARTPLGRIGLSICYDLRFPQLYRRLAQAGAEILLVPAAFTRTTGRAHWEPLLRARAIENGAYVIAASQCGQAPDGDLARFGHSLVVGPWGEILADAGEEEGFIIAGLDLERVAEARAMIPALRHDRPFDLVGA
ncbi:carbon-nitrogen hydrolase family protein [Benzoatithermus flavus]|uniref:Carbon-nitrogen hydrolase family protein n=1 Tax=Benzoatithermus flavus TaxID=3108223 RepID=A0ABU8XPX0_9PROT